MAGKNKHLKPLPAIVNRRASYDYALEEDLTVGLALSGLQVRAIRDHHAQLRGAFVTLRNRELWLNNLTLGITVTPNVRLLATKKQLLVLAKQREMGLNLVPVKLLTGGRFIKLIIGIGKSKKKYDKRQTIKERDLDREARGRR